ncbi:MAG: phosphate ABC transporter, permease protein PstA [Desulfobacteraceae bacterium 4484_190.1]|nr:MAG: phosphate ABC transporter, permease protein PstA [Desulfobacteraceae bacterium 4484_190.1]
MNLRSTNGRKIADLLIKLMAGGSAALGILTLGWILYSVGAHGIRAFDWAFFTELPAPPGLEGGGLANAIVGTLLITVIATLLGVPIGIMAGTYLSEFGEGSKLAVMIRFFSNVLMGIPSIIIGIFVYTIMVRPTGHFSGYAGAVALGIIMLPVVARTAEDMLAMVPNSLKEAALALGAPRWKVTLQVIFRAARAGLITGSLLAVARISGETAPLLFTALNSPYWVISLNQPTPNLTVTIFNYAMSPYPDWQRKAWGASLLIMISVLVLSVGVRAVMRGKR